jgi:hypothetical protein
MSSDGHCANITKAGERRRWLSGWAALLAGAIVVVGLASRGSSSAAYLVVFPFALGAAFGLLQARNRTCVVLSLRGAAEVEGGGFRRLDAEERAQARKQSRSVLWKSLGVAAAVTILAVLITRLRITA